MKTKSKTDVLKRETEDQTTAIKKLVIPDDGGKLFSSASDFREQFLFYWMFIFGKKCENWGDQGTSKYKNSNKFIHSDRVKLIFIHGKYINLKIIWGGKNDEEV